MALIDCSSSIGNIFCSLTQNVTGDPGLSIIALLVLITALAIALRFPVELVVIIALPLLMVGVLISGATLPLLGAAIFYIAILILRAFFLQ